MSHGPLTLRGNGRICVGLNFANQALFINFATLLWAMNISKAVDPATGREITPDPNALVDAGVVVYVPPLRRLSLSLCADDVMLCMY